VHLDLARSTCTCSSCKYSSDTSTVLASASGCFDVSVWIVVYLLGSWRSEFLLLVDLVESTRWTVARVACFRIFPAPAGISLHVVESCSAPAGSGWDPAALRSPYPASWSLIRLGQPRLTSRAPCSWPSSSYVLCQSQASAKLLRDLSNFQPCMADILHFFTYRGT